jgi:hypothetical protein
MVKFGEVYRSKDYGVLVDIVREDREYVIVKLRNQELVLYQNRDEFFDKFEKLTPLELELL